MVDFLDNVVFWWFVFGFFLGVLFCDFSCVKWGWDVDNNIGGKKFGVKVGVYIDVVFDFCFVDFVDDGVDFEG